MDTVTIDQATQLAATDFSLWALFIRADIVVKLVMIGLIVASVMSWSIIIEKIMTYRRVRQQAMSLKRCFGRVKPCKISIANWPQGGQPVSARV